MALHSLETDPEYLALQTELVHLQSHLQDTSGRLLVIFEGRDTAGKGGSIMRFARFFNPRHYRIVALAKPTKVEQRQWYFQKYIKHLPDPGEIVKDVARMEAMRFVVSQMDYPKKGSAAKRLEPDSKILEVIHNANEAEEYLSTHAGY
jgi:hypothetical protein